MNPILLLVLVAEFAVLTGTVERATLGSVNSIFGPILLFPEVAGKQDHSVLLGVPKFAGTDEHVVLLFASSLGSDEHAILLFVNAQFFEHPVLSVLVCA